MARSWINAAKNGKGWTVFWYDPDGKQRQQTLRLKRDAEAVRTKIERELDLGVYVDVRQSKEPLAAVFERWATSRGAVRRPAGCRRRTSRFRSARTCTRSSQGRLRATGDAVGHGRSCGLRLGEDMGLSRDRIDFKAKTITVDRQVASDGDTGSGKFGAQRLRHIKWRDEDDHGRAVPLPDAVALGLRRHLKQHGTWGPEGLLFCNKTRTGFLYPEYWYQSVWMPALSAAKVAYFKTHCLRHFYASSLLAQGVPMTEVSAWLGHSSVSVTEEYYAHLMPDAPDRARRAIDAALGLVRPVEEEAPEADESVVA